MIDECFMEFQKIFALKIIWNEKWDESCMLSQLQEGLIIKFCNKQPALQKTLVAWSPEALFFKALNWVSAELVWHSEKLRSSESLFLESVSSVWEVRIFNKIYVPRVAIFAA